MNTVGGVIAAGDPIMLIVPESDNLMAEVKVDPKDIDIRSTGWYCALRRSMYGQRRNSTAWGRGSRRIPPPTSGRVRAIISCESP